MRDITRFMRGYARGEFSLESHSSICRHTTTFTDSATLACLRMLRPSHFRRGDAVMLRAAVF